MNRFFPFISAFAVLVLLPATAPGEALTGGPYSLQPRVVDGGGAVSTGGVYEVAASTAQPGGVGTIAGGGIEAADGFWAMFLTLLPTGAPLFNYDIRPIPIDGFIDSRDLLGWRAAIRNGSVHSTVLFDFGRFWARPFPPSQP